MKQKSSFTVWYTVVLIAGLSLSGCSSISQAVSGVTSALTPSQQQSAKEAERPPEPVQTPDPNSQVQKSSILVEGAKPAPAPVPAAPAPRVNKEQQVDVNLGDNKQCTTFCALPLRKPAPKP